MLRADRPDAEGPAGFSESPLSGVLAQPLLLGLFLPIQNGGWSASTLPRTTDWTFDYNAALTREAEALSATTSRFQVPVLQRAAPQRPAAQAARKPAAPRAAPGAASGGGAVRGNTALAEAPAHEDWHEF